MLVSQGWQVASTGQTVVWCGHRVGWNGQTVFCWVGHWVGCGDGQTVCDIGTPGHSVSFRGHSVVDELHRVATDPQTVNWFAGH